MPTMTRKSHKKVTDQAVRDALVAVRDEIILAGKWEKDEWATVFQPQEDSVNLSEVKDVCGWKFCVGGAIVWETLGPTTEKGRARKLLTGIKNRFGGRFATLDNEDIGTYFDELLTETPLARTALYELAKAIAEYQGEKNFISLADITDHGSGWDGKPDWEDLVTIVTTYNDEPSTQRRQVVARLNAAIKNVEKRIPAPQEPASA